MKVAEIPTTEKERQQELDDLQILDTPAEDRFDRITRIARRVFDVPIALISLVDRDRQWFKSAEGLLITETSRELSFCAHAILTDTTLVVNDTLKDERFLDNPLVTGEPHIRFYAGQPLAGPHGHKLGTLCIIDRKPRRLSAADQEVLRDLAALVESELRLVRLSQSQVKFWERLEEAERKAAIDSLTRSWNREAILELLQHQLSEARQTGTSLGLLLIDLDHFKAVNDTYGHPAGDRVLRVAADRIRASVRDYDSVGRYGGEEFLVLLVEGDPKAGREVAERIRMEMADCPVVTEKERLEITASVGGVIFDGRSRCEAEDLIAAADEALYRAKSGGRNRVEFSECPPSSG